MAKLGINTGIVPNDNTGDSLILGAVKINSNFDEIYTYLGAGTTDTLLSPTWGSTSVGISTLRNVGVGTTNSTSALTVSGDAIITGVITASTFSGSISNAIYSDSSGISTFSSIAGSATTASRVSIAETNTGGNSLVLSSGASLGDNDLYIDSTLSYDASSNTLTVGTLVGSVSYASLSGVSTLSSYSNLSGISTYSEISGVSTFSNTSGISSYSDISGISTLSQGLTGTPNINVGVTTVSYLDVGFDGSIIRTTQSNFVGINTNDPANLFQVGSENQFISIVSHNAPTIGITTDIIGIDTSSVTIGLEISGITNIIPSGTTVVSIGLTEVGISTSTINLLESANQEVIFGYRDNTRHVSITSNGNIGVGTTIVNSRLVVQGDSLISGVVTATSFVGDGSGLTGVVGSGSGVVVLDDGSVIGTAGTINFATNLSVSAISAGVVTVTASGGGGGESYWASTLAGIHTLSNVGVGTTNPTSKLTVRDGDISVGVSTAHGVVLTSPNGTQFRLIVDNSGNLSTVAV